MVSHITLGTRDFAKAVRFYGALLAPLGLECFQNDPDSGWAGWKRAGQPTEFYICPPFDGRPASAGNGNMTAFLAPDPETVDAAYAAGMAAGGTDEGPPGPRPIYNDGYYGAYLRDPDGNKICICRRGDV
ncbi:MAG: putative dioxygenase [Roseomonas sp.]|jgi:catechol 2,3-dioxygenase-like lactoylglutathione lyase family enzyme|nr:putative dioxygenase [Roseomonas sp.]